MMTTISVAMAVIMIGKNTVGSLTFITLTMMPQQGSS